VELNEQEYWVKRNHLPMLVLTKENHSRRTGKSRNTSQPGKDLEKNNV